MTPRKEEHARLQQTTRLLHAGDRARDILRQAEEADQARYDDISAKRDEALRELESMAEALLSPPSGMTDEEVLGIENYISQVTEWLQTTRKYVQRRDDAIEDNEVSSLPLSIRFLY